MTDTTYTPDKKDVKTLCDLMSKQYFAVGAKLQSYLKEKTEAAGETFKAYPYMEAQRGWVWENTRVSNLFQSLLLFDGAAIPPLWVYRKDSNSQYRKVLDGQQRLTSLYLFTHDEIVFDMSKTIYPQFTIEGEVHTSNELHGKRFSELPELWRDIILNRSLNITSVNNCDDDTAEKIYMQLNSSPKALKPCEIRKAGMGGKVRNQLAEIKNADWMLHAMTPAAMVGNQGDEIISHMITLLDNDMFAVDLSSATVDKVMYKHRDTGLDQSIVDRVSEICDYLNETTSTWIEAKKVKDGERVKGKKIANYNTYRFTFFNKTNTVMFMVAAFYALRGEVTIQCFADWALDFFQNQPFDYKKACGSGSDTKPSDENNVNIRLAIIKAAIATLQDEKQEEFEEFNDIEPEEDVDIDALLENEEEKEELKAEENSQNADYAA